MSPTFNLVCLYDYLGNCQVQVETITNNLRFPGQYYDPETGLCYNLNRYYDPTTGRYLRADPFGAGLNLYTYCFNNPLGLIDPAGLCAVRTFFTLQGQADFWAGFGDTLTSGFGLTHLLGLPSLTQWIRSLWNDQFWGGVDYVNYESTLYSTGIVAGYIVESYLVSEGLLRIGGRIVEGFRGLRASEDVVAEVSSRSGGEILEGASWHEVEVESGSALRPGTLSNEAARKWYHRQLDSIFSRIDPNLPLRERALQAFKMRNEIKLQARELMADRAAAEALPAPKTLQDLVRKAYQMGLRGDDVWHYVLEGSQRSNAAVDSALGLRR